MKLKRIVAVATAAILVLTTPAMAAPRGSTTSDRALQSRTGDTTYGRITVTRQNMLPKSNPRSNMKTSSNPYGKTAYNGMTVNGRNLTVPETFENTERRVTTKNLPISSMTPEKVLNLPDSGKELNILLDNPKGDDAMGPQVDGKRAKNLTDRASASSRYPYLKIYGTVSQKDYEDFTVYMDALISRYPYLIKAAVAEGWTIVLSAEDLDTLLFNGSTDGVEGATCFPDDSQNGTVFVHAGEHSYCVIHEFGHVLDSLEGFPSQGEVFRDIYDREGSSLSEYGASCPLEFFAEAFMTRMLQPETTEKACPDACDFIDIYLSDVASKAA